MLCGRESLDWSLFSVDRFAQGGLSSLAVGDITPGVLLLETPFYKQQPSMMDLLHAGRNSLSSDPRDKVFALLSLGDAKGELGIQPDCAQTVEWLFTHVAVQSMKQGTCLDILAHVRGQSQFNFPSWVPDWTLSVREEPLRDHFSDAEIAFIRAWNIFTVSSEVPPGMEKLGTEYQMHDLSILSLTQSLQPVQTTRNRWQIHQERPAEDMRSFQLYTPQDAHSSDIPKSLPTRLVVRANRLATVSFPIRHARHDCNGCPDHELTPHVRPFRSSTLISSSPQCSKVLEFWSHILPDPRQKEQTAIRMYASIPPAFGSRDACPSCGLYKNQCDIVPGDNNGNEDVVTYHDIATYRNVARPDFHYSRTALESFKLQQARYGKGRVLFRTEGSLGLGPYGLRGGESV